MNELQKSNALLFALQTLAGEYEQSGRASTALRVREATLALSTSPDSMVRLYDILQAVARKSRKGDAVVELTDDELHELGQRLLKLVPGGSEFFSKLGDGFKVDVFRCLDFLDEHRYARLELAKIKKMSEPPKPEDPRVYPTREIVRRNGRYVQCQVMTKWTSSSDCPKWIACNDLETGEQFIASQRMGAWMEVDIIFFADQINEKEIRLSRISKIARADETDNLLTASSRLNAAIDISTGDK